MNFYEAVKNKLVQKAKKYAVNKIVDSDYLRDSSSVIPLTLVSIATRSVFNFLITWRICSGNRLADFFITLGVNVVFTVLSPMFNNVITKMLEAEAKDFMDNVIINFKTHGWVYFDMWKNRILGVTGTSIIIVLCFVDIDSLWIQETIVNMMITTIIVDYLNNVASRKIAGVSLVAVSSLASNEIPISKINDAKVEVLESYLSSPRETPLLSFSNVSQKEKEEKQKSREKEKEIKERKLSARLSQEMKGNESILGLEKKFGMKTKSSSVDSNSMSLISSNENSKNVEENSVYHSLDSKHISSIGLSNSNNPNKRSIHNSGIKSINSSWHSMSDITHPDNSLLSSSFSSSTYNKNNSILNLDKRFPSPVFPKDKEESILELKEDKKVLDFKNMVIIDYSEEK